MADENHSLAAHTPSPQYAHAALQQRILEHLGVDKHARDLMAPMPYPSKYPFSPKLMDALLTLSLDPIVKPLSLKGELDRVPMMRELSKKLANKGFFRRYPGGGIGIGGGDATSSDTGTAADAAPAGPGDTGFTAGDVGTGPGGQGNATGVAAAAEGLAAGAGLTGSNTGVGAAATGLGILGTLMGFVPGGQIAGLALAALSMGLRGGNAMGAFGPGSSAPPGIGEGGAGSAGGGQSGGELIPGLMTPMVVGGGGGGGSPTTPGSNVSAGTRANAAARVGGGISPQFLEALESIRGQS